MEKTLPTESALCAVWKQLLTDFSAGRTPASNVAAQAPGLIDHVDDCEICLRASQKVDPQHLSSLFEFLARTDGEISEEADTYLARLMEDLTDQERAIEIAVTQILLPSLPWQLRSEFEERKSQFPALTLFAAIEAIALMANRVARDYAMESIRLTVRGEICDNSPTARNILVSREALFAEVQEFAELSDKQAAWLSTWISQAAHFNPSLFLGLRVIECTNDDVLLKLEERKNIMALGDWWRAGVPLTARAPYAASFA